jgi:hypothetical protein
MFLLLEGETKLERWFLRVLKEVLKVLKGMLFKVCIERGFIRGGFVKVLKGGFAVLKDVLRHIRMGALSNERGSSGYCNGVPQVLKWGPFKY